ncbi:MAG: hypothetical protein HYR84_09305 [Planctomycetes bacterium]|nr:hypothetical protein [Planctomycetota bacterium]
MTQRIFIPHCMSLLAATLLVAGLGNSEAQELPARTVKFTADRLPFHDALKQLQEQTGITLKDRRTNPANPILAVRSGAFWPTLDDLCDKAGVGYSPHGGVTLVDSANPKQAIDYSGIFRLAVARVTVFRDDEAQAHRCVVTMDIAWEPHFRGVYLNLQEAEVAYESAKGNVRVKLEGQEKYNVSAKTTERIEIPMPAPPRRTAKLDALTGTLRVIGVPKMLDFALAKVKPDASAMHDGVTVRVPAAKWETDGKKTRRISIEVEIAHPPGAIVSVGSFEERDLVNLNHVSLAWIDPWTSKKHEWMPTGRGAPKKSKTGATYHFEASDGAPLPPPSAEPTLHVRTPNRVAPFMVPFALRDLPLP